MPITDPWIILAGTFAVASAIAALAFSRRKHGTAASTVAIGIGNVSGFTIAAILLTLPSDMEARSFWWEWKHNFGAMGRELAIALLAASLGMVASLLSLEILRPPALRQKSPL